MAVLTFIRCIKFFRDAKRNPLSVSDDDAQALHEDLHGLAVRPFLKFAELIAFSFEGWLVLGTALFLAPVLLGQIDALAPLVPRDILNTWSVCMAVGYVLLTVFGAVLLRAREATLLMSQTTGNECAYAMELVEKHTSVAAMRAQLLEKGHPLRVFHYHAFREMDLQAYVAERAQERERANQAEAEERARLCKKLHGIADADAGVVKPHTAE